MSQQNPLMVSAQEVAAVINDKDLVNDVSQLLQLGASLPTKPYDEYDPIKGIRKQWIQMAKILQADIAALRKIYNQRRIGLKQAREAPANRLTVDANQGVPTVDPVALKEAKDYRDSVEAGGPADLALTLRHGAEILKDSQRKGHEGAMSATRVTLVFSDFLLAILQKQYGEPLRMLQWALWRIRFVRLVNVSLRVLLGAALYFVLIIAGMFVEDGLEDLVAWFSQNKLYAVLILASIILFIEWIKELTIERWSDDWLRKREHTATAKEIAAIGTLAAETRILTARINAGA